jgi:hypothetical protein
MPLVDAIGIHSQIELVVILRYYLRWIQTERTTRCHRSPPDPGIIIQWINGSRNPPVAFLPLPKIFLGLPITLESVSADRYNIALVFAGGLLSSLEGVAETGCLFCKEPLL